VQRPERQLGLARAVGGIGELARLVGVHLDEGVQLGVELVDAREVRVDDVAARAAAAAQLLGLVEQREVGEFDGESPP
jgi:hypothetical protein